MKSSGVLRWAVGGAALLALLPPLYLLRGVLSPVLFAFLLAYMLDPLVDRIEAFGIPRAAAISVLLVLALGGLLLGAVLVLPVLVRDLAELAGELPKAGRHALDAVTSWLAEHGVEPPRSGDEVLERYASQLRGIAPSAAEPLGSVIGSVVGGTASVFSALAGAVMVPILAFYLLHDFDHIVAALGELVPHPQRDRTFGLTREVDEVLGQFVRGQLTVMGILAILYASAYALVGVRLAVPIGLLAGLLSFIPYVGGAAALGLALLMVGLHFEGLGQVLAVVAAYSVIQLLESFLITPRIVGDKLGLPPLWVLFALMVGGELFGFLGVMLALPVSAVIKVFVLHGLSRYRESAWFRGAAPAAAAAVAAGRLRHRRRGKGRGLRAGGSPRRGRVGAAR